ncbi:VOC family protein [Shouchella clausii]|uniref:VOC family protein n=1 Tax=Shouchella clausii TaxID=79880 RepID=UPI000BA63E93|nr:VOC family protein [Shouchella clausii]MCY1106826.1 VOC family protein [Shouchella clausii]PAD40815.1 glyoxalase [Bacillus sp. 7520-S]PAE96101.1 glyoxalase [Shouchella clausii]
MGNPILKQIGTVFIPVSDIDKAKDWYCDIFGFNGDGEILFGHLYVIQLEGTGIVLDSKIYSPEKTFQTPAFHFNTNNIEEAYQYMQSKGVKLLTGIDNNHYFNFEDLDGNMLMVCKC